MRILLPRYVLPIWVFSLLASAMAYAGPVVVAGTREINMGTVPGTQIAKGETTVQNTGDADLHIKSVRGSCGCVSGKIEQDVLAPGATTRLLVELDPAKVAGFDAQKSIVLITDDPTARSLSVKMTAKIDPEFSLEPGLFDFGDVPKGESVTRRILLRQLREEPVAIERVALSSPNQDIIYTFEKRPESEWLSPGKAEYWITGKVSETAARGKVPGVVRLFTNVARMAQGFTVQVKGQVVPFYKITPNHLLNLGRVAQGQVSPNVLTICADTPIQIDGLKASNELVQPNVRPGQNPNELVIEVRISETAPKGQLRGRIDFTVHSDTKSVADGIPFAANADPAAPSTAPPAAAVPAEQKS